MTQCRWLGVLLVACAIGAPVGAQAPAGTPKHYVFFGRERERILDSAFLDNESVAGAQLKYFWRELEPERDRYAFQKVTDDIATLAKHGKRLFIQLQDVAFSENAQVVPDYLLRDPAYGGGIARQYEGDSPTEPARFDGLVARRWDPAVRARFIKLLDTLGRAFDGRIEGLNFAETSIGFGESGRLRPAGFTFEKYAEGVKSLMTAARSAFPHSRVIVYANFMPGEDGSHARGYLRDVYAHAERIGVGVGGPDLLPLRRWQRINSLPLIAARSPTIIAGLAVQDGNLADKNPATGKRVSVAELLRFATDTLRLDYIFWGTEEPYYSAEVLPYLRGLVRQRP